MCRIKSSIFLINLQIGIGVLALPNTLHAIGMIPGIICILASGLITTYLDTVIGTFKRGHPEVYSIADTGYVMFGRFGKELFGGMYWVYYITRHDFQELTTDILRTCWSWSGLGVLHRDERHHFTWRLYYCLGRDMFGPGNRHRNASDVG